MSYKYHNHHNLEKYIRMPYEEFQELDINEQNKIIEKGIRQQLKRIRGIKIDGILITDEHIIKKNELKKLAERLIYGRDIIGSTNKNFK